MTSKTPKHIPNNSQSQVKKTGGVKKVTSTFKERVEDRLSDAYESKESLEVLGENFVENRVYLLRHYPYIEDDNYKEYTYLLKKVQDGEVLSKEDLKKFQDLEKKIKIYDNLDDIPDNVANIIKNIFSNDVQLFYCTNGKERVKITGNNLKDYYHIKDCLEIDLKGSDKSKQSGECQLEMAEQIGKEIEKVFKKNQGNTKNIVIVSNRSYANSFNILGGERDVGISGSEQIFEENGYMYIDYNKDKKIIKPKANTLHITPRNYQELKEIFPDISHDSIIDFQNKLNDYFIEKQELFEEYISKDNIDLQIFCIVNLLKKSRFDIIHKNRILLNKPQIKQAIIQANPKYEIIVNYYEKIYPNVSETRSKSLDERIRKGEDIKPFFTLSNEEFQDEKGGLNELKILTDGKPIKYIQGNAGNGKSFLLTHIAEEIHKYNIENINTGEKLFNCNYITLSGEKWESILEKLEGFKKLEGLNNVILLDSIDESSISGDKRKELDSRLLELSKDFKIVITSRNGYLYEYNESEKDEKQKLDEKQEIIELRDFNKDQIDDYLNTYFGEDEKKINKAEQILFKLNGAGNNPLILYMVCEIVEDGGIKDKEKNDEYIDIEKITVIGIYNEITEKRLTDLKNKPNKRIHDDDLLEPEDILKAKILFLSEISYELLINKKTFTENELFKIIKERKLGGYIKKDLQALNILFIKNNDGNYDFIHQSFTEYFAAKNICEQILKGTLKHNLIVIFDKSLNFLSFFSELLLIKNKEIAIKEINRFINMKGLKFSEKIEIVKILSEVNTVHARDMLKIIYNYTDDYFIKRNFLNIIITCNFHDNIDLIKEIYQDFKGDQKFLLEVICEGSFIKGLTNSLYSKEQLDFILEFYKDCNNENQNTFFMSLIQKTTFRNNNIPIICELYKNSNDKSKWLLFNEIKDLLIETKHDFYFELIGKIHNLLPIADMQLSLFYIAAEVSQYKSETLHNLLIKLYELLDERIKLNIFILLIQAETELYIYAIEGLFKVSSKSVQKTIIAYLLTQKKLSYFNIFNKLKPYLLN